MADEEKVQEQGEVSEEEEKANKEDETIFSEATIAGIKVKPWSFGILFDISPFLETVLIKAETNGLIQDLETIDSRIPMHIVAKLFATASPELLAILRITTGADEKTLKGLPMEDGIKLVQTVFNQNRTTIKNALAPLFQ